MAKKRVQQEIQTSSFWKQSFQATWDAFLKALGGLGAGAVALGAHALFKKLGWL
jgi:hypothetical protein